LTSHFIYGLSLQSNLALPGVPPCPDGPASHVEVVCGRLPESVESEQESEEIYPRPRKAGSPFDHALLARRLVRSGDFWLSYADGTQFVLDGSGGRVWMSWPDALTLEDAATYLLGPVLGFLLRLRGLLCLHASVVSVDGFGIALAGPPGAGKSTLAAAFAEAGFPVLSDDVAPIMSGGGSDSDALMVQPGYPRLRLWPDSLRALYGATESFARITPTWDKRHVELGQGSRQFVDRPSPLAAIYMLDNAPGNGPAIEETGPRDALIALVANTTANYLLSARQRAVEFGQLDHVARAVPVRRVRPPADVRRAPELCAAVTRDFRQQVMTPRPPPPAR